MSFIDSIVKTAEGFIGQQERQPNLGFKDPTFEQKMKAIGFQSGQSWCGYLVMLVLFTVYTGTKWLPLLKKYASPGTILMWEQFKASKEFVTGQTPKVGAIVIWSEADGKSGHTGIVITDNGSSYSSVEGNTNDAGSRNGYIVAVHPHVVPTAVDKTKRYLLGFVYMPQA